jgi:predicted enzyme related to lactoylglutathione lyase
MAAHGQVVWTELNTRDPEKAKAFYAQALGWTYDAMPIAEGGTYWVISSGGTTVGGIYTMADPKFEGVPDHWFTYFETDDVDRRVAGVAQAGGEIHRPPFDIPGIGRVAIVADSVGAMSGWMTSAPPAA